MTVLVTRPYPDNEATSGALQAKGVEALLAPMLRFEPLEFEYDTDAKFEALMATSANAVRAVANQPEISRLRDLPLFAVGRQTAQAAHDAGFPNVIDADGDGAALRERITDTLKKGKSRRAATLLYLAGSDLARDLASELGERGFTVVTQTTYRMVPVTTLPSAVSEAIAGHRVDAVLHYSRRSARAFVDAVRDAGVEISALALPQCCLSDAIGMVLRDAGAMQVSAASAPNEDALFDTLMRALGRVSR